MDWSALVQDRDSGQALVSAVMNLQVPQNAENSSTLSNVSRYTLDKGDNTCLCLLSNNCVISRNSMKLLS